MESNMKFPEMLKQIPGDFRFWICLFFVIRLYGITLPPIETSHSWRQSFTCMVARNFLEEDPNILLPRTDLSGNRPDVVETEFPLFNYMIFMVAKVFGYQHWYGRLINLIFTSIGIWCFFLLVRRYFDERVALFSGIILLSSVWFMFSRKVMPDTFSIALVITGLWFLSEWLEKGKWHNLLLFLLAGGLGGLCKIPATIILALGTIGIFNSAFELNRRRLAFVAFLVSGGAILWWYFSWEPAILSRYQNQLYFPRTFGEGLRQLAEQGFWTLDRFTFVALHSYVALLFFIIGIYFMFVKKERLLMWILGISVPILAVFMIKAGDVFSTHDYYIIPFVPVMALIAGYGLACLPWKKIVWIFLIAIMAEGIANQSHDFHVKPSKMYILGLEKIADSLTRPGEKIAITGGMNPEEMYYAHRKGWGVRYEDLKDQKFLENLKAGGCRYLFVNKSQDWQVPGYKAVYEDSNYVVYYLE